MNLHGKGNGAHPKYKVHVRVCMFTRVTQSTSANHMSDDVVLTHVSTSSVDVVILRSIFEILKSDRSIFEILKSDSGPFLKF